MKAKIATATMPGMLSRTRLSWLYARTLAAGQVIKCVAAILRASPHHRTASAPRRQLLSALESPYR
jgi:hypothetical protein